MKKWIKLYTEIIDDPKMFALSWAERGLWVFLLLVAGIVDDRDEDGIETGVAGTVEDIAWRLRCDLAELRPALDAFAALGMVVEVDGIVVLPNYARRQRSSPSARREAVNQRMREYRARQREA